MEKVIDVTTARRQFGTLLDEVFHKGDEFTIERKGKPLARIIPIVSEEYSDYQSPKISPQQKAMLDKLNSLPAISINQDPVAVLRAIRTKKHMRAKNKYGK
jgi:prevent-host-death family protein